MKITKYLYQQLGTETVLIKIPKGEKGPKFKGWQNMTTREMTTEYLAELDTGRYNIGVLLGEPSNHLCTIDIDDDEAMKPFMLVNPKLEKSLATRGRRGMNIWVRISGEYPGLRKIKTEDGEDWGEWRADGSQTVISGSHPEGIDYQILHEAEPIVVAFDEINWPKNLKLPWKAENPQIEEEDPIGELLSQQGVPVTRDQKGNVSINQGSVASIFTTINRLLYEPEEKEFYLYNNENGLWERTSTIVIEGMVERLVRDLMQDLGANERLSKITSGLIDSIVKLIRPKVLTPQPFNHKRNIIHLLNGILDLDGDKWPLMTFSDNYFSRNQIPVEWIEEAECPRFINELLKPCLSDEDVDLLQRIVGSYLLNGNRAQAMSLVIGAAGSGKSTLVRLIERLIGEENIAGLRTKQLDSNFELQFFVGKRMLLGVDVSRRFLRESGADKIKALVGGDRLTVEKKYSSENLSVVGDFHMLVTGNAMPLLNLDGDSEAWRRRLLLIDWKDAKLQRKIPNFDRVLFDEEGPGILNWALTGLERHLDELEKHGGFVLSETQEQRIQNLLNASDSVRAFVYSELEPAKGLNLPLTQLRTAYRGYCAHMDWEPFEKRDYKEAMDGSILERFGITQSHDVEHKGKSVRGYRNLNLKDNEES